MREEEGESDSGNIPDNVENTAQDVESMLGNYDSSELDAIFQGKYSRSFLPSAIKEKKAPNQSTVRKICRR